MDLRPACVFSLSLSLPLVSCGSTTDEKKIETLEEASDIRVAMNVAAAELETEVVSHTNDSDEETTLLRGEATCPGGQGTIHEERSHVVTPTTAVIEYTHTFTDCVVSDLTLDGSVTTSVQQSSDKKWTGTQTGTLETNLGPCAFDLALEGEGEIGALSEKGIVCGIDLESSR